MDGQITQNGHTTMVEEKPVGIAELNLLRALQIKSIAVVKIARRVMMIDGLMAYGSVVNIRYSLRPTIDTNYRLGATVSPTQQPCAV